MVVHRKAYQDRSYGLDDSKTLPVSRDHHSRRKKFHQSRREGISKRHGELAVNHYQICLYLDQKGNIQTDSSHAVTDYERSEILKEAIPKFSRFLQQREPNLSQGTNTFDSCMERHDTSSTNKQSHLKSADILKSECSFPVSRTIRRTRKRRRSDSEKLTSPVQDGCHSLSDDDSDPYRSTGVKCQMISLEVGDREKLEEYLASAFTSFLQINCRTICKTWIRTIEPKKQVNHPYNGNKKTKKPSSDGAPVEQKMDSEATKPPWWPPKEMCPHQEPDHIKKHQRIALLIHILLNTNFRHKYCTEDLRKATEADPTKYKPPEKVEVLADVWKIATAFERMMDGQIDKNTKIQVQSREEEARTIRGAARGKNAADTEDRDSEEESLQEEEVTNSLQIPTPTSSVHTSRYLPLEQMDEMTHGPAEEIQYGDNEDISFQFSEPSGSFTDSQAGPPMLFDPHHVLHRQQSHIVSGNDFTTGYLGLDAGDMRAGNSHGNLFPLDNPHAMANWTTSPTLEIFPVQYSAEPLRNLPLESSDVGNNFGQHHHQNRHRSMFPDHVHDYPASNQANFPARQGESHASFSRFNIGTGPCSAATYYTTPVDKQSHCFDLDGIVDTKSRKPTIEKSWV